MVPPALISVEAFRVIYPTATLYSCLKKHLSKQLLNEVGWVKSAVDYCYASKVDVPTTGLIVLRLNGNIFNHLVEKTRNAGFRVKRLSIRIIAENNLKDSSAIRIWDNMSRL